MCPSLILIGSKTAEKNSAQTNRQTSAVQYCCQYRRTQDLDAKWSLRLAKFHQGAKASEKMYIYSVPAQKTAKHRAKFGWPPVNDVAAVTKPRRETRWNLMGYPKPASRSQPLVGWSSPYCGDIWKTHCSLISFFPIVDTCLSCEDIARQSCAMVRRWRRLSVSRFFQRATRSTFQTRDDKSQILLH